MNTLIIIFIFEFKFMNEKSLFFHIYFERGVFKIEESSLIKIGVEISIP